MKKIFTLATIIIIASMLQSVAQVGDYDDMYFNSDDRAKLDSFHTEQNVLKVKRRKRLEAQAVVRQKKAQIRRDSIQLLEDEYYAQQNQQQQPSYEEEYNYQNDEPSIYFEDDDYYY